jgi:phosphatidylglycerol lysyltransferase
MKNAPVRLAAGLTAVMGAINLVSAVTPSLPHRVALIAEWSPLEIRHGGHLAAAVSGFALLLLAVSLARRKHAGWVLTQIVLTVSALSHVLKGLDVEEAAVAVALAGYLFSIRHHFHARSDPPSVGRGLAVLLGALVFSLAYGTVGFYLLDRHFSVEFGLADAIRQTLVMFMAYYDPGLQPVTAFGRWFADSIYLVSAMTSGYALLMLVRPVLLREPATEEDRARAERIIATHGRSSLARLALLEDKSYWFSPGGSVIAFAVKGRVAVALGDPIGPAEDAPAAVAGFAAHCVGNDWRPAFYQVFPELLDAYKAAGFESLCIGHEGIVDLVGFTIQGESNRGLRSSVNRLKRLGARAQLYEPPLPDGLLRELKDVSDEWLTMVHGTEKRFSLGWFDDEYIRGCPVMAVVGPHGAIWAFTNLVTEYQVNEFTVDLMRYRGGLDGGTMDYLFVELFRWGRERGHATFNFGLSALAGVGESPGDPVAERALRFIFDHMNRFYSFRGIHAFKEKFRPAWEPRHLVYPGAGSLPAVGLALIRADSGSAIGWVARPKESSGGRPAPVPPTPAPPAAPGPAPRDIASA